MFKYIILVSILIFSGCGSSSNNNKSTYIKNSETENSSNSGSNINNFNNNGEIKDTENNNNTTSNNSATKSTSKRDSNVTDTNSSNNSSDNVNSDDKKVSPQKIAPKAIAHSSKTSIIQGESVNIDALQSYDSDGEIIKYVWIDNNTTISTKKTFTINNLSVGNHKIILIVTDNDNLSDSDEIYIEVKENNNLLVNLKKSGQTTIYQNRDDGDYQIGLDFNYTKEGNIVIDNVTNLEWQDDIDSKNIAKNWEDAKSYCENLILDDKDGWRLPTRVELLTLVNYSKADNTFDNIFTNSPASYYWSSTTYPSDNTKAWNIYFIYGTQGLENKSTQLKVKCVRDKEKM